MCGCVAQDATCIVHRTAPSSQHTMVFDNFRRSFDDVWLETKNYYSRIQPGFEKLELSPKKKMALIFKWYFIHTTRLAMRGVEEDRVNYQIQCGPALGAFNQWVKGTPLESWRNRSVADIAERVMQGAADILTHRYADMLRLGAATPSAAFQLV